jgi:hypothetical protein
MGKESLLIAVILGIGALVSYTWLSRGPVQVRATQSRPAAKTVIPPMAKAATGAAAVKVPQHARGAASASAPSAAPPVFPPTVMTVTVPPDLPFPTPDNLKVGTTRAEIRAAYGEPAMDIAGIRNGRVLERYYYLNRERSLLTVVSVENGTLTSAESLSNPYFQLPKLR